LNEDTGEIIGLSEEAKAQCGHGVVAPAAEQGRKDVAVVEARTGLEAEAEHLAQLTQFIGREENQVERLHHDAGEL
jgi:hypothetical protein